MITKTFICDVCKKSVGETELTTITISNKMVKSPNGYASTQNVSKDVCVHCLKSKGLLVEVEPSEIEATILKNQKTFEQKFIDILEDLGVAFQE